MRYCVLRYEVCVVEYEVEATSKAEAVHKLLSGIDFPEVQQSSDDCPDILEPCDTLGVSAESVPDLYDELLRSHPEDLRMEHGGGIQEFIPSLVSVEEI